MAPLPYPSKLAGKNLLVFGGSSGIGFAVAALAVAEGARVHISSSRQAKLDAAVQRIQTAYPSAAHNISGRPCDLSNEARVEAELRALLQHVTQHGPLDHVVFTAGDGIAPAHISTADVAVVRARGSVRFIAPVMLAKLLASDASFLRQSPASSVTLTSGTNGEKPTRDWAVVAAYTNAVEGLARGLNVDMAPVRVNAVSPGAVETEIFDNVQGGQREQLLAHFQAQTTTGEIGQPETIAEAYLFIMKDRGMAGQVVRSDSGRMLA